MSIDGYRRQSKKLGPVRVALLFGTAVIALTSIFMPILTSSTPGAKVAWAPDHYDNIITGSIPNSNGKKTYTVRRSILQPEPGSVCIIHSNGFKSGDC